MRLPPEHPPLAPRRGVRLVLIVLVGQTYQTFVVHPKHAVGLFCLLVLLPLWGSIAVVLSRDVQTALAQGMLGEAERESGTAMAPPWLLRWMGDFVNENVPEKRGRREL